MRESYQRFVKTWIRFDSWSTNPDLKRFVSVCGPWIRISKGLYRIVDHESSQFSKRLTNPTNPTNPHKSLVLCTKRILTNNPRIRIRESDSMDSFRIVTDESNLVFPQILIRVSSHFQKVRFVSIRKDSYTNPASLKITIA